MILLILKSICLFLGIFYTIVNLVRIKYKNDISAGNLIFQGIGITGFIIIQFMI